MRTTARPLHDGWVFRQLAAAPIPNSDLAVWQPAEVPGHVHLDLLRLGVIPDPFARMHERTVQWVDDADWTYRCTFEVEAAELEGARQLLRFDGLDTIATVVLNDEVVATTENMFVEHEVDVTDRLRPGTNELEVRFESAERVGAARIAAADDLDGFHVPARRRHGLMPRSMVRKAQYHWGWDWGPRLRDCGIWRDVSLVRVPVARITGWSWRVRFDDDGATVTVDVSTDGDAAIDLEVGMRGHGTDVTGSGSGSIELGLLDANDGWLRKRFDTLGVTQFETWVDTSIEYEMLDAVTEDREAAAAAASAAS